MVVDGVHLSFVKGEEDQSTVVVEIGVVEQWGKPEIDPIARKVNGGIMAIVNHVGRYGHPLRKGQGIDIYGKVVEVANIRPTCGVCGDRIVDDERVVLAHPKGVWWCRGVEVVSRSVAILFGMSKTERQL